MKKLLAFAVLACLFTGCFSFTEEIRQEPDNTYTLTRTVAMGMSMFDMLASFKMMGDTTGITDSVAFRREMIDSLRREWTVALDTLRAKPGYISSFVRDTIIDTNLHIISSVHVTDAIHLPPFHTAMWRTMESDESGGETEKLAMKITKKNGKTTIRYVFPPMEKEQKKQSKEEREMAKDFIKDINIYFRVISPNLVIPKGKTKMKKIAGGLEYKLPLLEIVDGKKAPKSVEFVIK
ncbi:MAG TPA: hypothetical protein VIX80_00050 [Candidatus Kapabacteria bacterium]